MIPVDERSLEVESTSVDVEATEDICDWLTVELIAVSEKTSVDVEVTTVESVFVDGDDTAVKAEECSEDFPVAVESWWLVE